MALRSALINVMDGAARQAARRLVRDFGELQHLQVSKRGPAAFAVAAEKRCAQDLVGALNRVRPTYQTVVRVGDSDTAILDPLPDAPSRWLIDPLGGHANFAHGVPHFCVSIAVLAEQTLVAGVIYDPLRDETFWAERGAGAYLNHQRLRSSERRESAGAMIAMGFPGSDQTVDQNAMIKAGRLAARGITGRQTGSGALDLAYVAAGRFDGCWLIAADPVAIGAGTLIVNEAGGFASGEVSATGLLEGDVIAANPHLHPQLIEALLAA